MITPQLVFMIIGIAAIVAGVVLVAVAFMYYFKNDIRGVKDDLSGKARQNDARGRRRQSRGQHRNVQARSADTGTSTSPGVQVRDVPGAIVQPLEDDLDTVLDTKLRKVPSGYAGVSSDGYDVNDDTPTLVTSVGDYHLNDLPERNLNEADMPTAVDNGEEELPTQVNRTVQGSALSFVVTKSILAIHTDEIITTG